MEAGPIYSQAHRCLGRKVFVAAMSRSSRNILDLVVQTLTSRGIEAGGRNPMLEAFVSGYNPAIFEDAGLGWENKGVLKKLRESCLVKTKKSNTQEEILNVARLVPLFSKEWDVPLNPYGQFRFSHSQSCIEVHNYVVTKFLLDDFSDSDTLRLVEIVRAHSLEEIQELCQKIDQPDKKSIGYLYRVAQNEKVVGSAVTADIKERSDSSMATIAMMTKIAHGPKFACKYDPDWLQDAKYSQAMVTGKLPE